MNRFCSFLVALIYLSVGNFFLMFHMIHFSYSVGIVFILHKFSCVLYACIVMIHLWVELLYGMTER
jgi:branched-subunit amino acid permease